MESSFYSYWSANYSDVLELMASIPWSPVTLSDDRIQGKISLLVRDGTNYRKYLRLFPEVMCEPLELFYILRRATGLLNLPIAQDLLSTHGWRGANYGALLTLLAPRPEYLPLLIEAESQWKYARPGIHLAMAACGGCSLVAPELLKSHAHVISIREMLDELPSVSLPARPPWTDALDRQARKETAVIRAVYRARGLEAARALMKKGATGYLGLRYAEWIRLGCPEPPDIEDAPQEQAPLAEERTIEQTPPSPPADPVAKKSWWKLW